MVSFFAAITWRLKDDLVKYVYQLLYEPFNSTGFLLDMKMYKPSNQNQSNWALRPFVDIWFTSCQ